MKGFVLSWYGVVFMVYGVGCGRCREGLRGEGSSAECVGSRASVVERRSQGEGVATERNSGLKLRPLARSAVEQRWQK